MSLFSKLFSKNNKEGHAPSTPPVPSIFLRGPPAVEPAEETTQEDPWMTRIMPSWQAGEVILDTYEVEDVITSPGRGRIYVTRHRDWKIRIAIKSPAEVMLADLNYLACVMQEAKAWTALGPHLNIAYCYFVRGIEGIPHVFVEYVDGGNLRTWIEECRCADLKLSLDLAIQFCHAMAYAHSKGVIHRDIKPENILLTRQGTLKVTDFGIGRCWEKEFPGTSLLAYGDTGKTEDASGADGYASPEQWRDAPMVGPETDIFSFGVCLWEMLLGWRPYTVTRAKKPIPDPRRLRPDLPARLYALLEALVAFEVEARQALGGFTALKKEFCTLFQDCFGKPAPHLELLDRAVDGLNHQGVLSGELGSTEYTSARFKHALERGDLPTQAQTAYKLTLINGHASWITIDETEHRSGSRWQNPTISKATAASLPAHRKQPYRDAAEETLPDPIEEVSGEQNSSAIKCLATLEGHMEGVTAIDFSPDGRSALSGSSDKTLRLWDLETHKCRATLTGHTEGVTSVGFSPDGRSALSGSWDKTLRLWDLEIQQCRAILEGHTKWVTAVGFSPDGRSALSGSWDKTLRLWDLETQQCRAILMGHTEGVAAVGFNPDGQRVLSGSWDKSLRLWG